jgi:outer membrane biosynthesis protein TonB
MRTAYTISGIGHGTVLLWSIWSLAANPLPLPPHDALPVDLVTSEELSKVTKGIKTAPQSETPKPLVEKVAEAKPVEDPTAKVVENKEVKAARETASPPEAKPPDANPAEKKHAETKIDPIAQELAKEEAKKPEPKKAELKPPAPPKKPAPPAPKFDPKQVEALLDKRDATRMAAAGEVPNNAPSLGVANGDATRLSQNEFDAFRKRLEVCWSPPPGVDSTTKLSVVLRVLFKSDGSVARPPDLVQAPASPLGPAMAESAKRAILRCQPFKMLKPEHYDQWKDIEINFDPQYMLRG